jgi:hypothetical protein
MIDEQRARSVLPPDHKVFCIEEDCNNTPMVKDAIWGGNVGDWYCSERCKSIDKLKYPNR